jgi:F0F1-type ATP synthase assembly protein I
MQVPQPKTPLPMDRKAVESMQRTLDRGSPGVIASYGLIGSVLLLGGLGFLVDQYFQTEPWGVFVGLLVGVAIGLYQIGRILGR